MAEWLVDRFGPTLGDRFFLPFHDRYTAGLTRVIAPQDAYSSSAPGEVAGVQRRTFRYPIDGIDGLARPMADRCDVRIPATGGGDRRGGASWRFADGTRDRTTPSIRPCRSATPSSLRASWSTSRPIRTRRSSSSTSVPSVPRTVPLPTGSTSPTPDRVFTGSASTATWRATSSRLPPRRLSRLPVRGDGVSRRSASHEPRGGSLCGGRSGRARRASGHRSRGRVHASWVDVAYTWRWPDSSLARKGLVGALVGGYRAGGSLRPRVFQGIAELSVRVSWRAAGYESGRENEADVAVETPTVDRSTRWHSAHATRSGR